VEFPSHGNVKNVKLIDADDGMHLYDDLFITIYRSCVVEFTLPTPSVTFSFGNKNLSLCGHTKSFASRFLHVWLVFWPTTSMVYKEL